jgi:hypothetical protein
MTMKHIKTFESFLNESMETLTGDPHEYTRDVKKNMADYREIITSAIVKEFKLSDALMNGDFFLSYNESMGDTKAILTLINKKGTPELEDLAVDVEKFINKFVEKNPKIKKIEYGPTTTGKVANTSPKNGDKKGNWEIMWSPKFFIRKTN